MIRVITIIVHLEIGLVIRVTRVMIPVRMLIIASGMLVLLVGVFKIMESMLMMTEGDHDYSTHYHNWGMTLGMIMVSMLINMVGMLVFRRARS